MLCCRAGVLPFLIDVVFFFVDCWFVVFWRVAGVCFVVLLICCLVDLLSCCCYVALLCCCCVVVLWCCCVVSCCCVDV